MFRGNERATMWYIYIDAHLYHIVGLSMLDAEDRYGSEDRYWRFGWHAWGALCVVPKNQNVKGCCHNGDYNCLSSWGTHANYTHTEGSSQCLGDLVLLNNSSQCTYADLRRERRGPHSSRVRKTGAICLLSRYVRKHR